MRAGAWSVYRILGRPYNAAKNTVGRHEGIGAVTRARKQTHCLTRHADVAHYPAFETAPAVCCVFYPKGSEEIQCRSFEGSVDFKAFRGELAHDLLLHFSITISAAVATMGDCLGQSSR